MSARRFFLLQKQIKRLRERGNYDFWLMVNWINFKDQEYKEKIFQKMIKTAFPECNSKEERWWENVEPGLHLMAK